ncbi:hypothetical protein CLOP_g24491 [Closterium sp. NIES-67]|nr:hypothetical protein CLOP_g24491 [Closterium sp. NIES-67]
MIYHSLPILSLLLASALLTASPPSVSAQSSAPVDSTAALNNALNTASNKAAGSTVPGSNSSAAASLTWTASLLSATGVDQEVINARGSRLGALLIAPTNYAWQQLFEVLERANAKQPAASWTGVFVGYPSITPATLLSAATSITTTTTTTTTGSSSSSSSSGASFASTFTNFSAPLDLTALTPDGRSALRGVLLLHLTSAYYVESQLRAMASPNASNAAPQHGHVYAVSTNQTIQIHTESDNSLVFRMPANANTPVGVSPYTAYAVTAAATVLPGLTDAVADGKLAVQGVDHVLLPPIGPANAGGRALQLHLQVVIYIAGFTLAFLFI